MSDVKGKDAESRETVDRARRVGEFVAVRAMEPVQAIELLRSFGVEAVEPRYTAAEVRVLVSETAYDVSMDLSQSPFDWMLRVLDRALSPEATPHPVVMERCKHGVLGECKHCGSTNLRGRTRGATP